LVGVVAVIFEIAPSAWDWGAHQRMSDLPACLLELRYRLATETLEAAYPVGCARG
jgi:hypothetical protein